MFQPEHLSTVFRLEHIDDVFRLEHIDDVFRLEHCEDMFRLEHWPTSAAPECPAGNIRAFPHDLTARAIRTFQPEHLRSLR